MPPNSGPETVDYRVSRLIVLCKDCGEDVGLYPARHKCRAPERPPLPTLVVNNDQSPGGYATYWDMFKNTLWRTDAATTSDNDTTTPGGALWTRVMEATTTVAKAVGVVADDQSDSDVDENGETKVTRELKDYYVKQGKPLPSFLLQLPRASSNDQSQPPRNRIYDSERDQDYQGRPNEYSPGGEGYENPLRQQRQNPDLARQRMQVQQKVPIPIRARPLRDEEDPQEMYRRQEAERFAAIKGEPPRMDGNGARIATPPEENNRRYAEREAALAALDGRVNALGRSKRDYGMGSGDSMQIEEQRRNYGEPPPRVAPPQLSSQPQRQEQLQAPPPRSRDPVGGSRGYDSRERNGPRVPPREGSYPLTPPPGQQAMSPGPRGPPRGGSYPLTPPPGQQAMSLGPRGPPREGSYPLSPLPGQQAMSPGPRGPPPPRSQPYGELQYRLQAPPPRTLQGPPPSPGARTGYDLRYAQQPSRPLQDTSRMRPPPRKAMGVGGSAPDPRMIADVGYRRPPERMDPRIDPRIDSKTDPRMYARMDSRADPQMDPMSRSRMDAMPKPRMNPNAGFQGDPRMGSRVDRRMPDPRMERY